MGQWITVFKEKVRSRAELLKNELEINHVPAVIFDKVDHVYPVLGTVEIKVRESQKERAESIIKEFRFND